MSECSFDNESEKQVGSLLHDYILPLVHEFMMSSLTLFVAYDVQRGEGQVYAWCFCTMVHTSLAVTFNASQSILGRTLHRKEGLYSMSDCSSSASSKWRGKERGEVLHALTAQVRKFTVRIFISELYVFEGRKMQV